MMPSPTPSPSPAAILALIGDLYTQIAALSQENEQLRTQVEAVTSAQSPPAAPAA